MKPHGQHPYRVHPMNRFTFGPVESRAAESLDDSRVPHKAQGRLFHKKWSYTSDEGRFHPNLH